MYFDSSLKFLQWCLSLKLYFRYFYYNSPVRTEKQRLLWRPRNHCFCGHWWKKQILTDAKAEKIYFWIEETLKRNIQPITIGEKKPYKDWTLNQLLVFRYQMNITNSYAKVTSKIHKSLKTRDMCEKHGTTRL